MCVYLGIMVDHEQVVFPSMLDEALSIIPVIDCLVEKPASITPCVNVSSLTKKPKKSDDHMPKICHQDNQ